MLTLRRAHADDREAIWQIFHDVVAEGSTYAYPSDTSRGGKL